MSQFRKRTMVAIGLLIVWTSPAYAGIVVTIDNLTVQPGFSQATVDVWIESEAGSIALTDFGFVFRLDPVGFPGTHLRFVDPQQDLQLSESNYVFAPGSRKRDGVFFLPPEPVGMVSTGGTPSDTYSGFDISVNPITSFPFGEVTLDETRRLMVRLQLESGENAPLLGDQFTITLVNSPNTNFQNAGVSIDYEVNVGIVTLGPETSVSAIPEPSSLTIFAALGTIGWATCQCHRRRHTPKGGSGSRSYRAGARRR